MRIAILFHFRDEQEPSAITEVEGEVTDVLLPLLGDTVTHRGPDRVAFRAIVVGRHFDYSLAQGEHIDGTITVVLSLDRLRTH